MSSNTPIIEENQEDEDGIYLSCLDGSVFMPMYIVDSNKVLKDMKADCGDINNTPVLFNSNDVTAYINLCKFVKKENLKENIYSDQITPESHQYLFSLEKDSVPEERKLDTIGTLICISDFLDNPIITDLCAKYIAHRLSKLCNFENKSTKKTIDLDVLDSEFIIPTNESTDTKPEISNASGLELLRKILQVENDLTDAEIKKIQSTNTWCLTSNN